VLSIVDRLLLTRLGRKEHQIEVKTHRLARGGFGIVSLTMWRRRPDGSQVFTTLWVADAATFETADAAAAAGVQLAQLTIDDGIL